MVSAGGLCDVIKANERLRNHQGLKDALVMGGRGLCFLLWAWLIGAVVFILLFGFPRISHATTAYSVASWWADSISGPFANETLLDSRMVDVLGNEIIQAEGLYASSGSWCISEALAGVAQTAPSAGVVTETLTAIAQGGASILVRANEIAAVVGIGVMAYQGATAYVNAGCPGLPGGCTSNGVQLNTGSVNSPAMPSTTTPIPPGATNWIAPDNQSAAGMGSTSNTYGTCPSCTQVTVVDIETSQSAANTALGGGASCSAPPDGGYNAGLTPMWSSAWGECYKNSGTAPVVRSVAMFTVTPAIQILVVPAGPLRGSHVLTEAELSSAIANGLKSGNVQSVQYLKDILNQMDYLNQNFDSFSPALQTAIQNLRKAIEDAANGVVSPPSPAPPGPNNPPGPNPPLTDKNITEDVRKGVDEALQDQVPPPISIPPGTITAATPPGDITPSEKKNLTSIMDSFKAGLSGLPLLSWLSNQAPSITSGSSSLTFPFPSLVGGPKTVNFADYESSLDFMGNALLSIVGIGWTMFLLKGRGD